MTQERSVEALEPEAAVKGTAGGERSGEDGPVASYAFFEGRIIPFDDSRIHVLTQAFNCGTAVFERIRGYYSDKYAELCVVRLQERLDGLLAGSRILLMEPGYSASEMLGICVELLRKNRFRRDTYVRPIV